jgi:outer membrane protein assembly factor BamB
MKNLSLNLSFSLLLICVSLFSQNPQIKWWYDVNDECFGQSACADIDGDGKLEVVFSCYRNDSSVYALNLEDGSLLWKVNTGGCNDVAPLIYDVDMDDSLEVVLPSSCVPKTFCFKGHNGKIEWVTSLHGSDSPPTVGDIDNDGKPEILHGNFGGWVTCLNGEDGSVAWDLPVDMNSWIQTAPIILDADNDGQLDFIVGNWSFGDDHKIWCFRGDNHQLIWDSDLPNDYMYHGASFADIDGDGFMEIAIGTYDGTILVLNAEDGSLKWDYSFPVPFYAGAPTSMADINNDGFFEIVFIDGDRMGALDKDGNLLWEFDMPSYYTSFRGPAISDINDDDTLDIVFGTSGGVVHALNGSRGNELWNLSLRAHHDSSNFEIDHAPVIADFDGDGVLDIFVVGGHTAYPNIQFDYGRGYALSTGGSGGPDWTMFRRDCVRSACVCDDTSSAGVSWKSFSTALIEIFPNPGSGEFVISLMLNKEETIEVCLIDAFGREIVTKEMFRNKGQSYIYSNQLYTTKLNSGLYFIRLNLHESYITKKLIVGF